MSTIFGLIDSMIEQTQKYGNIKPYAILINFTAWDEFDKELEEKTKYVLNYGNTYRGVILEKSMFLPDTMLCCGMNEIEYLEYKKEIKEVKERYKIER